MSISQPGKDGVTMEKKGYVIMLKNITEFKELDFGQDHIYLYNLT